MPYKIVKIKNQNLYKVINTQTGFQHSKGSTKTNAEKQKRLLEMFEKKK